VPASSHSERPRTAPPIDRRQRFVRAFSLFIFFFFFFFFFFFVLERRILQTHSSKLQTHFCPATISDNADANVTRGGLVMISGYDCAAIVAGSASQNAVAQFRNGGVFRQGDFALGAFLTLIFDPAFALTFFLGGHSVHIALAVRDDLRRFRPSPR